ncbi:hypothetical protein ABZ620_06750 [Nocardiopsis alba]|uniref:hypothetical protein n=1 Tax=Nocardiopsis alba TaxID=53437 RepID=UPI0033CD0E48
MMSTERSSKVDAGTSRNDAGRTYLGWRHRVLIPPPGPAPRRPAPEDAHGLSEEWIAGQRDSEALTNRPLYYALGGLALLALLFPLLWSTRVLPGPLALGGVFACAAIAAPVAFALVQSRQVMARRLARAEERIGAERAERERLLRERQHDHARKYTEWRAACRAYEAQPHWYGVTVPSDTSAVVVVGGTDSGWSALLTTVGISRLREGGDLTVVDLTGRGVTRELVRLARRCAVGPRHWVLPADLPRMTLGTDLDAGQRARILSAVAAASGRDEDSDADETLLLRLLEVLGPDVGIDRLIGGLRALVTPAEDMAEDDPALALLGPRERERVRERCADVPDARGRAWRLEQRLSPFEAVGTRAEDGTYAQVKIISTDRASGPGAARVYGTYAVAALSELLEARTPSRGSTATASRKRRERTRTVVVCGAETLPEEEVDQVLSAAEDGGVEVVLMFREAVPLALRHLDGPSRLPVLMRQSGPEEGVERLAALVARASGGRGVDMAAHGLTEAVGGAVGETAAEGEDGGSEGEPDDEPLFPSPHTESGALIRNAAAAIAPLDLVRHVRSATVWGRATAKAAEADTPNPERGAAGADAGGTAPDTASLRSLAPTTALVLTPDGPVPADTNPGILTLATATLATAEDHRNPGVGRDVVPMGAEAGVSPESPRVRRSGGLGRGTVPAGGGTPTDTSGDGVVLEEARGPMTVPADDGLDPSQVPPNLGPPPERLDWRV